MPVIGPLKMESTVPARSYSQSMDQDGTKAGYDLELIGWSRTVVSIPVIASGGVGNLEHIYEGLTRGKASAALAAIYFPLSGIFHRGM